MGAMAPPRFLKIGEELAFSTPNISRFVLNAGQMAISIPNIVHLPPGLYFGEGGGAQCFGLSVAWPEIAGALAYLRPFQNQFLDLP